ncbi:MAG: glucosamine-6-phosphate deaminase [Bacteroidales bacterium]|jgi:glucosamine-6-phosphate deaminase
MLKQFKKDTLEIKVFETREKMGLIASQDAADYIRRELTYKSELSIVFASAPSQNDFLSSLLEQDIDWGKINAFHMDEFIGLPEDAPQGFGNFLKSKIFDKIHLKSVNYLYGKEDPQTICDNYSSLLKNHPIDIVFMGIGENAHIAFNDPHVALFDDPERLKVVSLDLVCRRQQVNDGFFKSIDEVPTHAITLTIPVLLEARRIFCMVPAPSKAKAIKAVVSGEITEKYPASILRTHKFATLYCDKDSAKYIL